MPMLTPTPSEGSHKNGMGWDGGVGLLSPPLWRHGVVNFDPVVGHGLGAADETTYASALAGGERTLGKVAQERERGGKV